MSILDIRTELIKEFDLNPPDLEFANGFKSSKPMRGLLHSGPYDYEHSDKRLKREFRKIKIFCLYPKGESRIKKLLREISTLLVNGHDRRVYTDCDFPCFETLFKTELIPPDSDDYYIYTSSSTEPRIDQITANLAALPSDCKPIFLIGGRSHRSRKEQQIDYIFSKKIISRNNLPSQFMSYFSLGGIQYGVLTKLEKKENVGYSLWNIGLGIYGKVGGIAWTIPQVQTGQSFSKGVDITIGLGFARLEEKDSINKFYIGCASILDKDGRWIGAVHINPFFIPAETRRLVVPQEIMRSIIKNALRQARKDVKVGVALEKRTQISLAVHKRGYFHAEEVIGVREGISDIETEFSSNQLRKRIFYNLISVIKHQDIEVIDSLRSSKNFGVRLNTTNAILYTGRPERGIPPIRITCDDLIEPYSYFENIQQIGTHINNLTLLHWQTTIPRSIKMPASLYFASRIAVLEVKGIKPPNGSPLLTTPWFI